MCVCNFESGTSKLLLKQKNVVWGGVKTINEKEAMDLKESKEEYMGEYGGSKE